MRLLLIVLVMLGACSGACKTSPTPPAPPTPQPPVVTAADQAVYNTLVEAGCLAPSSDGPASVALEKQQVGEMWLVCLYDGGTISGCNVPCK